MLPKVFIIILNWKAREDTAECINSVKKIDYKNYEIIVVDNGSGDGSVEYFRKKFPGIKIIANDRNLGYAGGNNVGIRYALDKDADYVLILNNDTTVTKDFLGTLIDKANTGKKIGIIGPRLKYPDGREQPSGRHFLSFASLLNFILLLNGLKKDWKAYENNFVFKDYDRNSAHEVDDVGGCATLIKAEVFEEIGLFDEKYLYCFEEVDFEKRAKEKGWSIWYLPQAVIYHKWGVSAKYLGKKRMHLFYKGLLRYTRKHIGLIAMLFFGLLIPMCYFFNFILRLLKGKTK